MHYAEVPIPTTLKQGAYGLCVKGNGLFSGDRNLLSFDLRIGRIGSLPSIPVQIRCSSVEGMYSTPLNKSSIGRWIKSELSGFNIIEVVCVDDDQVTDSFLQFGVPIEEETNYPKVCRHKGKSFSVDHALPYATPIGMRARPPHEQSVHEHWKKAARLAPQEKRCHANCIAKSENCPRSLQRVMKLRESSVQDHVATFSVYTEQTKMPWCFFTGSVSEQIAIDCFCKYGSSYLENKEDIEMLLTSGEDAISSQGRSSIESPTVHIIQICCRDDQPLQMGLFYEGKYGWTISTAELVQCHAYTPCTLVIMTPPGYKLADICTPSRHYTTRKVFARPGRRNCQQDPLSGAESFPTQLSPNRTASLVSPPASERYLQEHSSHDKPGIGEISSTAPWTDTLGQSTSQQIENRQLPLLRRSSDKVTPKTPKTPLQTDPGQRDLKVLSKPTATPQNREGCSHRADCIGNEQRDKNKQLEQISRADPCVANIVSKEEVKSISAHKDSRKEPNFKAVQELVVEAFSKAPSGMPAPVEKSEAVTVPQVALSDHTAPAENYVLTAASGVTPQGTPQVDIGVGASEAELPKRHQLVISPPIARVSPPVCYVQTPDFEMQDVNHSPDIRKRGITKDGVSKSCPPSLRAGSRMLLLVSFLRLCALPILFEFLGGSEPAKSEISYAVHTESEIESIFLLNAVRHLLL